MSELGQDVKFKTVIEKNTFYFHNRCFEERYEADLHSLKEILLTLRNEVDTHGLNKEFCEKLLLEKEHGLRALLALTGLSNETLKRLITLIRIKDDKELNVLVEKHKWCRKESVENLTEWTDSQILKLIRENKYFRKGVVSILFEGGTVPFLAQTIPLFELRKLSSSKLRFEIPEMIDTLIRYKEKGSYSGKKDNNAEVLIEAVLNKLNVTFETGDLSDLVSHAHATKRTMDFIIPNKSNPRVIVESSFLTTTSSGQGDKSKTEITIGSLIKQHYPESRFIGFIDGVGWYVRKGDLRRMVSAYEDVFTFREDELKRFEEFLVQFIS
ncbi:MAG: hypothetical protein GDA54_02525 [Alphaproteobacteria bacterium GM7ARS4]|nr:hypothetical protein [Alphaproteobacteria bacterium GM7ARS4]